MSQKPTTEGSAVQGGASRILGGRDDTRSQSATIERWVPPSAIKRDALPENSDDEKFRKVRGILNKLTPQTFDRLSDELIRIGLDSQNLLKGVILLIFEKALQEPKYVCMYAQLCKKLSKKVPNFDPPNPDYTTTFRRLLLNKCQDEYENRARASAVFDQRTERLTPEEEEEKQLAKRKMLGNIKFIGELGKLEMLTHSILHKCCEELVKKTKAEDLECLCQIMSTCGHLLDTDKGKYLMNQYFARMQELSKNDKLPSRIRFMLQDVLELRGNHWLPRQTVSVKESPKLIQDIRREAHDELGISDGSGSPDDFRYLQIDPRRRVMGSRKKTGMEDVFAPIPFAVTSLGTGPGVITQGSGDKALGLETNGYHHNGPMNNYRPAGGMRSYNNQNKGHTMNAPFYPPHQNNKNHFNNQHEPYVQNNFQTRNNHNNAVSNGYEKAPVAPRFMKHGMPNQPMSGQPSTVTQSSSPVKDELSLRPPPNSMMKMFTQPKPSNAFMPKVNDLNKPVIQGIHPSLNLINMKENSSASAAKNTIEKLKPKKEKGPSKEDIIKQVEEGLAAYLDSKNEMEAAEKLKELKIPDRYWQDVLNTTLCKAMDHSESERDLIFTLMLHLVKTEVITRGQFLDSYKSILDVMGEMEPGIPRIKTYVAAYAARAVFQEVLTLSTVAEPTDGGNHYPFLLLILQQMTKFMEKSKLCKLFEESKINLLNSLPKIDRTKDRMADILEERELSFLFPLLKIQAEMTKQLQTYPDPESFGNWISENVDSEYHTSPGFVSALMTVVFKYIAAEASQPQGGEVTEKSVRDKERDLLVKFKPILAKFLSEHVDLQIIAIYALQAGWYAADCPKVMLLRWFVNLYELEILEEDAFLKWKEDIRDEYPGKGNALFQVNQWLLWLEQADEDDEEDDQEI